MSAKNVSPSAPSTATQVLGSWYGACGDKAAFARETSPGNWQVKVHDPTNPRAGHDGWLLIGAGWPSLSEASTAAGLS